MDEKLLKYGKSEHGNYAVVNTIGVPHPYMITGRHVGHASDNFGGMLGEAAIESGEKKGIVCGTCRGKLTYKQHEHALLVECKGPLNGEDGKAVPELHEYLLKCKALAEADHYAGFAFVKAKA